MSEIDDIAISFNQMFVDMTRIYTIPTKLELERMSKYSENDSCSCGGRLMLEIIPGNMGQNTNIKCSRCDFKESITDLESF